MVLYTKESLESLRLRIDLIDVLSSHIELKPAGATYKALCPFHDEKTPSFVVTRGDSHYHCFGCNAHGDAIQFLMAHLKLSFVEAVENLASRFNVHLEKKEGSEEQGPSKKVLKDALSTASRIYHFLLLHTPEGQEALQYLYRRGIDLSFIRQFQIGLAPKELGLFRRLLFAQKISMEIAIQAGLLVQKEGGKVYDFFYDRITFPIADGAGAVIGFSARKYKDATTGGKYVNSAETPLFKKSRILFGLNFSRKRMAKERRVILVEGQLDALRLIDAGLALTVASQGTAFGDGHVKELQELGIEQAFLAFDADSAGQQAAIKVGHLLQKGGISVYVVELPDGEDPDSFLRKQGPNAFIQKLSLSQEYLAFLVNALSKTYDMTTPGGKSALVDEITKQIRSWENPVLIHESLRKVAQLMQIPEEIIGLGQQVTPHLYLRRASNTGLIQIDPDRILETDLLRLLMRFGKVHSHFFELAELNISEEHFRHKLCYKMFKAILDKYHEGKAYDLLAFFTEIEEEGFQSLIDDIMTKKIKAEKAEEFFLTTLQKMLDRTWMDRCESIRIKIASGLSSDEEVLLLVKEFDQLKRNPIKIKNIKI